MPGAALAHFNLAKPEGANGEPRLFSPIRMDAHVADFLDGLGGPNPSLVDFTEILLRETESDLEEHMIPTSERASLTHLTTALNDNAPNPEQCILVLSGPSNSSKLHAAGLLSEHTGFTPLIVDLIALREKHEDETRRLIELLFRDARLYETSLVFPDANLLFDDDDSLTWLGREIAHAAARFPALLILMSAEFISPGAMEKFQRLFLEWKISPPGGAEQKEIWQKVLNIDNEDTAKNTAHALASRFNLSATDILRAVNRAQARCLVETGEARPATDALFEACRVVSSGGLAKLAKKVETPFTWDDLVVPAGVLARLKEACAYFLHSEEIYRDWGFNRVMGTGRGLNILFSGPPGTGKTMAAGIMATELGIDLYKIDLSTIVSKYIGETEKNLSRIFSEARNSNAVLFFDEADALFGKRSEVQSSHDRFANIEVGFLLQKMEEYEGMTILATNLSENMDEAFRRRLKFMLEFPMPGPEARRNIWRLALPSTIPLEEDPDLDFLSDKFELSGAAIKGIALHAAFIARQNNSRLGMRHLILGLRHEYEKEGKPLYPGDLGAYASHANFDEAQD